MLLGSHVDRDLALPGLTRLEHRQGCPHLDLHELLRLGLTGNALADLPLREMPPFPLRNQRREVPLALERDPGTLRARRSATLCTSSRIAELPASRTVRIGCCP